MYLKSSSLIRPLFPLLCAAALISACASDTTGDDPADTTTSNGTQTATGDEDTDDPDPTPPDPTETDGSFVSDPDMGTTTDVPPGNLGDPCMSDSECMEDLFCNGVPGLGGICSECGGDSDCPDGSNCTFSGGWFACGDGSVGQMCESDASCGDGLYCAEVIDLGGFFNGNFCSECAEDGHCPDGQLCAPQIEFMDLANIGGQRACIDPDTAPDGSLCDESGSGDEQCEGFCTIASLMGFIELGVCGECETDADCVMGSCLPAMVGMSGFSGSSCG